MGVGLARSRFELSVLLLAVLLMSACGGGGEPPAARPARLAAANLPSPLDVDMLLDWAEVTYPPLFPRSELTLTRVSPGYGYY